MKQEKFTVEKGQKISGRTGHSTSISPRVEKFLLGGEIRL